MITRFTKLIKEINPYKETETDCIPAKLLKEMAGRIFSKSSCLPATSKDTYHRIGRRP